MNKTVALVAAVGSALLALFYFVTNALPVLRELDSLPASALVQPILLLLLPQLLWTGLFLAFWCGRAVRQAALVTLLAGVAPQMLDSWVRMWPTLSLLSLDSILYLFGGVIQPLAYSWFLLAVFRNSPSRVAAYILWVLTTFQALALIFSGASLEVFVVPAILIFHASSQSFFFRAMSKREALP